MSRNSKHSRRLAVAAALALSLTVPIAATGTAFAAPAPGPAVSAPAPAAVQLQLPTPTGRITVGRKTLHLVDEARTDPWVPAAGPRELMVSMHYPARKGTGRGAAPYLAEEEARLLMEGMRRDDVSAEVLAGSRTNSRIGARPLGGRFPLAVLSPGFTLHRGTLTMLAEELASRGYVVASVDHAYESFGTVFPGGRVLTREAGQTKQVPEVRAADVSFLLDQLLDRKSEFARMIDGRRIGMAGHSIGGNSAAVAMARDPRIGAGVNLDGGFFDEAPGEGMKGRPFLLLGTDATHRPESGKGKWREAWDRMDGWKRWLTVAGSGHFTFNDIPVLGEQVGMTDPTAPLSGTRSGEITVGYTSAFFDHHLRGKRTPLLDGPTTANPEVSFHRP
ncbi:alpha/beta hydrolase family protein [Streptomyces sp. NPDC051561]|uniref:alpha/beta hydrolase family protein n=1 Tax=Streptomyces sp. NPDC051561 TaxID=3365658 RepID=UPI0037B561DD